HAPQLVLEARLLALVCIVGLVLPAQRVGACSFVVAPAAGEFRRAVCPFVELDDAIDGAVEEIAIVRDEHDRAGELRDGALEPVGPTRPMRARGGTTSVTSCKTSWAPWYFVMRAAASKEDLLRRRSENRCVSPRSSYAAQSAAHDLNR